jgi:hypothetical protein
MALHTKKEFAKLAGMKTGNLTNYIKRGKVVQQNGADGLIDSTHQINLEFLNDRVDFLNKKIASGETPDLIKKEINTNNAASSARLTKNQKPTTEISVESNENLASLKRQKERADLEKKLIDTQKAKLEFAILQGKNVPVDMVRDVFTELGKTLLTSYKDSADSFVTEISHRHKIADSVVAELRGELVLLINKAHSKAIETATRKVNSIVQSYKKHPDNQQDESESNTNN